MKLRRVIPVRYACLLGVSLIAACCWAVFLGGEEASDFEWPTILKRILAYCGVIFVALVFLSLASRWLFRLLRWLFSWRNLKRGLIAFAFLAVVFALVHVEENWRGRRAWEAFKREWEAKGERFDFASFVPPPVPDDQNFALTPIVASCYSHVLDRLPKVISGSRRWMRFWRADR